MRWNLKMKTRSRQKAFSDLKTKKKTKAMKLDEMNVLEIEFPFRVFDSVLSE